MANSSEHISIRLPKALVDDLRRESQVEQRSLAWVVARRLQRATANSLPTPDRVDRLTMDTVAGATVSFTSSHGATHDPAGLADAGTVGVKHPEGGTFAPGTREVPTICPSCSSTLVPWGPMQRCVKCERNW